MFTVIDMDECRDGINACQETCTNTIGSYICGCNEGYRLNSDGQTCYGMPPGWSSPCYYLNKLIHILRY